MSVLLDIGSGVTLRRFAGDDGQVSGYIVAFADGCSGSLLVRPSGDRPVWSQTGSVEAGDLTLRPSVDLALPPSLRPFGTDDHRHHGFVTDGKWVSV